MAASTGLHISISAERLFTIGGMGFTNSMLTSLIVSGLLIAFAVWVNLSLRKTNRPTGVQNFAEFLIEGLYNLVYSVTGDHKRSNDFFPFIVSFFLIIIANNWFGLLPGVGSITVTKGGEVHLPNVVKMASAPFQVNAATVTEESEVHAQAEDTHAASADETGPTDVAGHETEEVGIDAGTPAHDDPAVEEAHGEAHEEVHLFRAGTADLNTTLALGIMSMALVQFFGFKYLSAGYLGKFFNFSNPINTFVGLLELISDISKIISFAFRLFGNVFAGEVLLTVITFLTKVVVPMPFYGLELFVGFIQALVFAMLSIVLFNMATLGHGEEH